MRIIYAATFFLLLLLCVNTHAQNAPVTTAGSFVTAGNDIIVPLTVTNFTDIGGFQLRLEYDAGIAQALSVTPHSQLGGSLAFNISSPGIIVLSWFKTTIPGVSLPDNTEFINIHFTRANNGSSPIEWDTVSGFCKWFGAGFNQLNQFPASIHYIDGMISFLSMDSPVIGIPDFTSCQDGQVHIPAHVTDFKNIGSFFLTLTYDPLVLEYQSFSNASGFPAMIVNSSNPGVITLGGLSQSIHGISLAEDAVLFELNFHYLGNSTAINWNTEANYSQFNGPASTFTPLDDLPKEQFFLGGFIEEIPLPDAAGAINGPPSGVVRQGQENVVFSINPLENADSYVWNLPPGASITAGDGTNIIHVSFTDQAVSGDVTVYATNDCGSGLESPVFVLTVKPALVINEQRPRPLQTDCLSLLPAGLVQRNEMIHDFSRDQHLSPHQIPSLNQLKIPDGSNLSGNAHQKTQAEEQITIIALSNSYTQQTTLRYFIPEKGRVIIGIINMKGEEDQRFELECQHPGLHEKAVGLKMPGVYVAVITHIADGRLTFGSTKFVHIH